MQQDPRIEAMRDQLSHDLAIAQAYCQYDHTVQISFRLLAVAKYFDDLGIALIPIVAPKDQPVRTTPIIRTASATLRALGYSTNRSRARWTSPGSVVFPSALSAHECFAAILKFRLSDL